MKLNKNTNTIKLLTILAVAAFATAFVLGIRTDQTSMQVDFLIDNVSGFNVDTDAIHLGAIMPGSTGIRNITIRGNNINSLVYLYPAGNITKYVYLSDRIFVLKPNAEKQIIVSAHIPLDASYGNFTGTLEIRMIKLI